MSIAINDILVPFLSIGGMGLFLGAILGVASKLLAVREDPTIGQVMEALPGANCGACGFTGCLNFAEAVVNGDAPTNGCPVGGETTATAVAEIMGGDAGDFVRMTAYVHCKGDCETSKTDYEYYGMSDCNAVQQLPGHGPKTCQYGCLGFGSCEHVCEFGAISFENGIAVVDMDKCTACAKCVNICPRNIIDLQPAEQAIRVSCTSTDPGGTVRKACDVGCIGCTICAKTCPEDAIEMVDGLAVINVDKCTQCEECIAVCPTNAISNVLEVKTKA